MEKRTFVAEKNGRLTRIAPRWLDIPYAEIMKSLRKKDVKINGRRVSGDAALVPGDEVEVYFTASPRQNYKIVFRDDNVLVIDKPCGVLSEKVFESIKTEYNGARFIHRLDRNTSGIMIFALNEAAERELVAGFKNRTFIKVYRARVKGTPHPPEGVLKGYLLKDAESASVKITDKPCKGALPVKTGYRVLESDGVTSLVEIRLYTGRTHQIRAQFAHVGCPVAGDGKYGDAEFNRRLGVNRQQLNARSLTLVFGQGSPLYYLNGKTFLSEG